MTFVIWSLHQKLGLYGMNTEEFKNQDQSLSIVQCLLNFKAIFAPTTMPCFQVTPRERDQSSHPHPGCVYSPAVQIKVIWAMHKVLQKQFFTTPELMRQSFDSQKNESNLWSCLGITSKDLPKNEKIVSKWWLIKKNSEIHSLIHDTIMS